MSRSPGAACATAHVLDAMRRVPREAFVEPGFEEFAYEDGPLPIGEGQTISQPYIVALMIEAAEVKPGDRVLEVGAGSGYAAAVLSQIADQVYAIERHPSLGEAARATVPEAGLRQYRPAGRRRHARLAGGGALRRHPGGGRRARGAAGAEGAARRSAAGWSSRSARQRAAPDAAQGHAHRRRRLRGGGSRRRRVRAADRRAGLGRGRPTLGHQSCARPVARAEPAGDDRRGGRAPARSRRSCLRAAVRPLRRPPGRAARRGQPRHVRVLPRPRRDHPPADRGARLHHRRRRGGLAGRRRGRPLCAPSPGAGRAPSRRSSAFPTWMWRNTDVAAFIDWMREHNESMPELERAGRLLRPRHLQHERLDRRRARVSRQGRSRSRRRRARALRLPHALAEGALRPTAARCSRPATANASRRSSSNAGTCCSAGSTMPRQDGESFLDAAQNARLVASAERYYRIMYYGGAESWNLRDTHMFETLEHLLEARGPAVEGGRLGAQLPYRRCPPHRHGRGPRASSTSASSAASASATRRR